MPWPQNEDGIYLPSLDLFLVSMNGLVNTPWLKAKTSRNYYWPPLRDEHLEISANFTHYTWGVSQTEELARANSDKIISVKLSEFQAFEVRNGKIVKYSPCAEFLGRMSHTNRAYTMLLFSPKYVYEYSYPGKNEDDIPF